jgi:hypothetical protein
MRRCLVLIGVLFAALMLSQLPSFAQNASGSISGTVTDATGAVVPNAKVVLTDEATNTTRETVSNNAGVFRFAAVLPGSFKATVSAPGLQTWEQRKIVLTQGASISLPSIVLQVAGTKQEVMVMAEADVVVPVDSGQTSQTLNKQMVESLSIVGRDAAELMKIMPGMGNNNGLNNTMWNSYTTASNTGPIGSFSANGTQPYGALTMTSDGANLLDPGNQGTQTANINQNQVAEVSILTSAYGAEFAKGPVTFQAIGKSGGAQFHGGAYLYARNGEFNAIDSYSKNQGGKPLADSFYYPGGDLGGPVIIPGTKFNKNHDKLFFYTAFEYMKQQPAGNLQNYFVPTAEMMNGNFSPEHLASLGTGFANARSLAHTSPGGNAVSQDGLAFPGGMIPQSQLDPNSKIYLSLFPKPNTNPATNSTGSNYQFFVGPPQNRWEYRLRGDYNISENTKLFFSWNEQHEGTESPISIWWSIGGSLPYPSNQVATQVSRVFSGNLVHVFSPTLTNEFVFAQAKFLNPIHLTNPDAVNPDKLGFKYTGLFATASNPQIPNTFGWNNSAVGFATYPYADNWKGGGKNAFGKISNTPNISDNVTKVQGTHTLKAGFYWDYALNNQTGAGLNLNNPTQGAADFENWGSHSTGNPIADLIMGRVTQYNQFQQDSVADAKYTQYSFYVNDSWKASRRLTLNLGLRFEHMGNWVTKGNTGFAVWDPALYKNGPDAGPWPGATWHAINSSIPVSGFPSRQFFYEPRFGAAYDLFGDGKTVLRGGAGLYRYQLAYNSVSGAAYNTPQNLTALTTTWGCCVGWQSFNQYSPATGTPGWGSGPNGFLKKGDDRTPYTWTFNVTVSQRLPWRSVVEAQYSGNRSRDMMLHGPLSDQNLIPVGAFFKADPITGVVNDPASGGFPTNDYYPMQHYTGTQIISHGSYSNYNAAIFSWQKQTGRITFTTNYTFSKVLGIRDNQTDNGNGNGNTIYPFNMKANYGVLNFDHTHIINAAYVVNLPDAVKNNKVLGGITNGWIVSGITQWQSGAPIQGNTSGNLNVTWPSNFSPAIQLGTNAINNNTLQPRLTCDPRKGLASGQYFNPGCFAPPAPGTYGDIIWPYIKGPAYFNSDLALYKTFTFKEHQKIELRFSAFNFLNHPLQQIAGGALNNSAVNLNFSDNNTLSQKNVNALTNGFAHYTVGRRVVEFAAKYNF